MGVLESQPLPWAANTLQIPLVLCYGTSQAHSVPSSTPGKGGDLGLFWVDIV